MKPNDLISESVEQFESRKDSHIHLALDPSNESTNLTGLDKVQLTHNALPEIDFPDISIKTNSFGNALKTPFLISPMTAGHANSTNINEIFAEAADQRGWLMGVGSQRRQLFDPQIAQEWKNIRKRTPNVKLLGNIGLSQLINTETIEIQKLCDSLQAEAMIIHTNPLQECIQLEGTPFFKGGLNAIELLCNSLEIPVILKETGCGFSKKNLNSLCGIGLSAVDISGFGGTHWGRIEGARFRNNSVASNTAKTFKHWGVNTVDSLCYTISIKPDYEVWGSGGVRSGLDAAKLLALGANIVGIAKPLLESALKGLDNLLITMETFESELKTALFCTGSIDIATLQENPSWEIVK